MLRTDFFMQREPTMLREVENKQKYRGFYIQAAETQGGTWLATVSKPQDSPVFYNGVPRSMWMTMEFQDQSAAIEDAVSAIDARIIR